MYFAVCLTMWNQYAPLGKLSTIIKLGSIMPPNLGIKICT